MGVSQECGSLKWRTWLACFLLPLRKPTNSEEALGVSKCGGPQTGLWFHFCFPQNTEENHQQKTNHVASPLRGNLIPSQPGGQSTSKPGDSYPGTRGSMKERLYKSNHVSLMCSKWCSPQLIYAHMCVLFLFFVFVCVCVCGVCGCVFRVPYLWLQGTQR